MQAMAERAIRVARRPDPVYAGELVIYIIDQCGRRQGTQGDRSDKEGTYLAGQNCRSPPADGRTHSHVGPLGRTVAARPRAPRRIRADC